MITKFDKPSCRLLGEEAQNLLVELAAKHGLTASYGGGQFDETSFTMRMKFSLSSDNPNAEAAERELFNRYCHFFGLKPEHYGTFVPTVKYGPVQLIGFNLGRSRFKIKVRLPSGKLVAFDQTLISKLKTPGTLTEVPFEEGQS